MMMNCPMMQSGLPGMMGCRAGSMPTGGAREDQGVASLNARMHREMAMEYTGKVAADFIRNLICHYQGAIDMAKIEAAFGKDPKIRELAQNVIKA